MIFVKSKLKIIYIHEASVEKGIFYKTYWSHGFCKYVIESYMDFCKKMELKKDTKLKLLNKK